VGFGIDASRLVRCGGHRSFSHQGFSRQGPTPHSTGRRSSRIHRHQPKISRIDGNAYRS
jgi:hypothetical protein